MIDILVALAVLGPALGGAAAWSLPPGAAFRALATGVLLGAGAALGVGAIVFSAGPQRALAGAATVDALGAWILLTVAVGSVLALAGSPAHLRHADRAADHLPGDAGRYLALLGAFVASLAAVPLLTNLGLVWVAVEAGTVAAAFLVGSSRTPHAIEAAWKYLILGSVGVGFALLATLLAYASSVPLLGETSNALDWPRLVAAAPLLNPGLMRLAFLFALVGYGTKVGLAPFHTWLPDAHSQAPSPISALLSGVSLNVALYVLIRFHLVAAGTLGPGFSSSLLILFGLASLAVALPFIVAQGDLKRLLAYSSIEHMGLLAVAIGVGGRLALVGVALHLLGHALVKSTLFLSAGRIVDAAGTHRLGRLGGTLDRTPVAGAALLVGVLLIGGLPPSSVFASEFAVIVGGVGHGAVPAVAAAALLLALAFAGLTFHAVRLAWGGRRLRAVEVAQTAEPNAEPRPAPATNSTVEPTAEPTVEPPPAPTADNRPATESGPPSAWRSRAGLAEILLYGVPLSAVVVLGLWTPGPLQDILNAVAAVLGGPRG